MSFGKFRLSRWQIAAAVLSLLIAVTLGTSTYRGSVSAASYQASFAYRVCTDGQIVSGVPNQQSCVREREKSRDLFMQGAVGNAIVAAILPLPFIWFAAFCLYYFVKAQIIGFRSVIGWHKISTLKKSGVVASVVAALGFGMIGAMYLMNLYVDTVVPVVPAMHSFVNLEKGSNVTVTGTWTRTDLVGDTIADPLQTSQIHCWRLGDEQHCFEAKAEVAGNSLSVSSWEHNIKSWTASSIILEDDDLCSKEIFTIDLNTQVVSGVGQKINESQRYCRPSWATSGPNRWTFQMEEGFKVYWEERQKARPFTLRVFQALFGN